MRPTCTFRKQPGYEERRRILGKDSRLEYHKYASTIQIKTVDANTVKTLGDKQRLVLNIRI